MTDTGQSVLKIPAARGSVIELPLGTDTNILITNNVSGDDSNPACRVGVYRMVYDAPGPDRERIKGSASLNEPQLFSLCREIGMYIQSATPNEKGRRVGCVAFEEGSRLHWLGMEHHPVIPLELDKYGEISGFDEMARIPPPPGSVEQRNGVGIGLTYGETVTAPTALSPGIHRALVLAAGNADFYEVNWNPRSRSHCKGFGDPLLRRRKMFSGERLDYNIQPLCTAYTGPAFKSAQRSVEPPQ